MFKFFMTLAMCAVCAGAFAANAPIKLRDAEAAQKYFNDSANDYERFHNTIVLNLSTNTYNTFNELRSMVQASADKYLSKNDKKDYIVVNMSKIICNEYTQFQDEAFGLAKMYPTKFDVAMYLSWKTGLSNDELYTALFNSLVTNIDDLDASLCNKAVDRLIKLGATSSSIKTQKSDLQVLNRLLSPKVLKDKAKWEPVCSAIRTAIETY